MSFADLSADSPTKRASLPLATDDKVEPFILAKSYCIFYCFFFTWYIKIYTIALSYASFICFEREVFMRPEILYPLFASISTLKGVGSKTTKLLQNLFSGDKIIDTIFHLPTNLINRSYSPALKDVVCGQICTIKAKVIEHIAPKSKNQPYKVIMSDGTENLHLIFFKIYPDSIAKNLPIGATRIVSGKIESFNGILQMSHPDYIVSDADVNKLPKFEPVYPLTAGISNKTVNRYISQALEKLPKLPE